jgi:hypothetical protein
MHRLPQGGLSVAKNDQAKMYGKNKELLIIGREKAYDL